MNLAGILNMTMEAAIDFVIRKPVQKREFTEIFNKIILQLHMQLNQVSLSMNDIFYPQGPLEGIAIPKPPEVMRSTSAFIKDLRHNYGPLSFTRQSENNFENSSCY